MKISKINTGLYSILLVEIPYIIPFNVSYSKKEGLITLYYKEYEDIIIDIKPYLDNDSLLKLSYIGILGFLDEKIFRHLIPLNSVFFKKYWFKNRFKNLFYELLKSEDWKVDKFKTLIFKFSEG